MQKSKEHHESWYVVDEGMCLLYSVFSSACCNLRAFSEHVADADFVPIISGALSLWSTSCTTDGMLQQTHNLHKLWISLWLQPTLVCGVLSPPVRSLPLSLSLISVLPPPFLSHWLSCCFNYTCTCTHTYRKYYYCSCPSPFLCRKQYHCFSYFWLGHWQWGPTRRMGGETGKPLASKLASFLPLKLVGFVLCPSAI